MGPRTGLDDVEKRKFFTLPGLELRPLRRAASRYTDWAIWKKYFLVINISIERAKISAFLARWN
jgi:hypothetical protein